MSNYLNILMLINIKTKSLSPIYHLRYLNTFRYLFVFVCVLLCTLLISTTTVWFSEAVCCSDRTATQLSRHRGIKNECILGHGELQDTKYLTIYALCFISLCH